MATISAQQILRMATPVLLVVGIFHAMQQTIAVEAARDCGCSPSYKWVCGADGKWYSSMCQAMCEGVQGGNNTGLCNGMLDCEYACLARVTLPITPGSPDYCPKICPFPPFPPLNYSLKIDGADICYNYRRQCRAVCSATRLNPVWRFTQADNFFNSCYQNCCHQASCSMYDKKK